MMIIIIKDQRIKRRGLSSFSRFLNKIYSNITKGIIARYRMSLKVVKSINIETTISMAIVHNKEIYQGWSLPRLTNKYINMLNDIKAKPGINFIWSSAMLY